MSLPESTRSLPNLNLNLSHENVVVDAPTDLGWVGRFEEQGESLNKVGTGLFDRCAFACNVELRTQRDKTVVLPFNDCGNAVRLTHAPSLSQFDRSHSAAIV
jgi:hypothetical protein